MRNKFDEQLDKLNNDLVEMGALCESAIACAVKALLTNDKELAKEAMRIEDETDHKETEIETLCLRLLLQQQPVARDLRVISAALKMITDMERIADQAEDIAEIVLTIDLSETIEYLHVSEMAQAAIKMVTDSVESFVAKDLELARSVMAYDDIVDGLFIKVRDAIVELISKDPRRGLAAVDILMIAKYLERIGDHATNIAEWVEFSITGVHVSS
ncbi:MAG: phosphate signaling complex protein PhoU [Clostridiales bacterium]|nr:phosphate signaling complex protein PhoU [Clostridiales bacterium]